MNSGHYRFKFYLNARHIVSFQDIDSKIHPHTWEIVLHVKKGAEIFIQFSQIEGEIRNSLSVFEGGCLNDIAPFDTLMPTMENMGEVFSTLLQEKLAISGWRLMTLEISENPGRTYIVTPIQKDEDVLSSVALQWSEAAVTSEQSEGDGPGQTEGGDGSIQKQEDGSAENGDGSTVPYVNVNTDEASTLIHVLKRPRSGRRSRRRAHTHTHTQAHIFRKLPALRYLLLGTLAALAAGAAVFWFITREGVFPWGSDSWYHLFKGHQLFKSIQEGNFYPLYSDIWYNGIQPLRYWAPLPHYVLAALEFFTNGNTALSYNLFIVLVFTAGAMGWLLWGLCTGRRRLAFLLALLWFFLPDNLRVLFSEGNLSRVAVSAIFPYLLLSVTVYFERGSFPPNTGRIRSLADTGRIRSLSAIAFYMLVITLCHAMISAMVAVTITLFAVFYGFTEKKIRQSLHIIAAVACGIAIAGIWLVPALTGGLLAMDSEAVKELAEGLTYPALDSLNPLLRLKDPNVFYFGVSIFAVIIFGLLFGSRKVRAAFAVAGIIFLGTTKALLPIIIKLPLSQVFWMMRFTPLAMGIFFAGLLLWKGLKKELLAVVLVLVVLDSAVSFRVLAHDSELSKNAVEILKPAASQTSNRLALLDGSRLGSFPGFYLGFGNSLKNGGSNDASIKQVFGSGWQGAATAENIMWLNTALEKHWYGYLFDRCLEHGADVVTITKTPDHDETALKAAAEKAGYKVSAESTLAVTFKYPVNSSFGTIVNYEGLGIGKYAAGLSLVFPQLETGESVYLDDYSLEELLQYKIVYLSGFTYKNREAAENLVKSLSERSVRVVVDLNNAAEEIFSSRANFLGVLAEEAAFKGKLPEVDTTQGKLAFVKDIPEEYEQWRALYLENLDNVQAGTYYENHQLDVIGTKLNQNIVFIGLNLPYYAMLTGDSSAVELLETVTGLEASKLPDREMVQLDVSVDGNTITLHAGQDHVMTGIAALDTFQASKGSYTVRHNFVYMQGRELVLNVRYPEAGKGLVVSALGTISLITLLIMVRKKRKDSEGVWDDDKK